jgi:penicillin-binding protein 1B
MVSERFMSRRWSVPSKVYSDTMILYTGQRLDIGLLLTRLKRTGYRDSPSPPASKGEMNVTPDRLRIFLYDLHTPWAEREGFPASIEFSNGTIVSMRHSDGSALPIIEVDPEEIALFFGQQRERRQLVALDQIPDHLIHAVLAAEDARFFQHRGVDPLGILRAATANLRDGRIRQGGSTITQQLAKNYFLTHERSWKRKFQEIILAFVLELKFTKNEILEIYLNEIYFGQKGSTAINGVGEAARFYFGKPVQALTLPQAAALAGLIKAPNKYSPYVNATECHTRKNIVLAAMLQKGWLKEADFQSAQKSAVMPVGFTDTGKTAPYFIDYISQQLMELYKPQDLASLGLSIYTTMDPQVQKAAEKALENGLKRLETRIPALKPSEAGEKLQGAVVVLQPRTGHILAMVGGRNYSESQFNRITQARRQPGSAFKPFVFAAGLDKFTPISLLSNEPKVYQVDGTAWEPRNLQRDTKKRVTVRSAIENSYNLAAIDLAVQVGLAHIVDTAKSFGFSTVLEPYPSLALGAFEVIPLELARAYGIFAAGGVAAHPLALKSVVDENGGILEQRYLAIERIISPQKAFVMNAMLKGVIENGTARSVISGGFHWPAAGKTGTTNNERDAWFIGYTPDILALVWVGFDNGKSIRATGSTTALPIWLELMKAVPHHISGNPFREPDGIVKRSICGDAENPVVSDACSKPFTEYFLQENAPSSPARQVIKNFFKGITDLFKGQ